MALYATVYLSLMGEKGLREVNKLSCDGAHYLYDELIKTGKFHPIFNKPFLKEFVVKTDLDLNKVNDYLLKNGIMGGIPAGEDKLIFAVTEKRTKEDIDRLVTLMLEA